MGRIHDAVFNPQPRAPKGYRYRKTTSGEWRLVCDMCGSNCGQCGDTDRLGNFVDVKWADGKSLMQNLVDKIT